MVHGIASTDFSSNSTQSDAKGHSPISCTERAGVEKGAGALKPNLPIHPEAVAGSICACSSTLCHAGLARATLGIGSPYDD
jgi:hypothetical protein